jgi:hypothetical protein
VLDNAQDVVMALASSQSIAGRMPIPLCELNCANARGGSFYKRTEGKRTLNQDFLDRFFLQVCTSFDHDR